MHQVTVTPGPSQQPSPRRLAPSTLAMSLAWEGFSQRNSRIAVRVLNRNAHSMRRRSGPCNLYLYGYTVYRGSRRCRAEFIRPTAGRIGVGLWPNKFGPTGRGEIGRAQVL